ncbi:uncharacterized protein SPSK_02047 [Sporothrix schenckii 1099-18]|uniref:Integral membrane protein n=3 Tax=Sporothrix TaxID=29907 RepID=U7PIC3_SPOS1|nr:uncharacterized protein SPSK_02047 [Sporothrix schenckii 1099-18]XP_040621298.1 uncharacterized protein SPBR_04514 [Sporothrix brasiliensis 5110]ERS95292.1 hypothetical protein HMPREF1624_08170 [Sporothrix schenckii ATCC 58251]KIH93288.1 membrane protein [Sporothrix brasiliensis 5110]KJR87600.1 membrane protein [Sporothrix schenckii 1099-18]
MSLSISGTLSTLLGLLHVYILVLEMFLWTTPRGRKSFKLTADFAEKSRPLAANMGLYNGFLAAGLFWGLVHPVASFGSQILVFFQGCIVVAGLFGAATSSKRILYVQAIPGALTLAATLLEI